MFREKGRPVGFEAKGHTGYADEGSDIVCAAVSALTQAAAIGLLEVIKLQAALEIDEAHMYCMLQKDIDGSDMDKAELILETLAASLRSLAETHGDYIKLTDREV